jgi:class 3 adenylate cyclase/pimeloyl-ACP methyl ester carboxylesterase
MVEVSEVRYARSADGIDIAYQIVGDGPIDLVFVSGFISHLDLIWELPAMAARYDQMSEGVRLLLFDKRGTGLSDRTLGFGSVADRMDDIRAVMDAAGFERAALMGVSEGGPLTITFAATYPHRVTKLALLGTFARVMWAPDYPTGVKREPSERWYARMRETWGTGESLRWVVSDAPEEALPLLGRYERSACTPNMVEEIMRKNGEIDVRDILPAISVPTLVMHASRDPVARVEWGRYLAEHIPGAQYVEIDSDLHGSWNTDWAPPPEYRRFMLGDVDVPDLDRMLATVLFTDIVSSTERTARVGDQHWRKLLDHHDRVAQSEVARFRGNLVNTTGDGLLATFDGPARAIGCAQAIRKGVKQLGIDIRAGLHTGEIELRGKDVTGLGVVIARRICDTAATDEVLASRTVKDLVTGSGITFDDRGTHALKGVPDDWQLYAVAT